jgi:Protein of unknown function (DUF2934)
MYNQNEELPTREQIERRAYQIYLEHGFHPGSELTDWLAAEKELTEAPEAWDIKEPSSVVAGPRPWWHTR